ncbi:hypothetical protein ACHAW5_007774 [Stephanodiscus triporus]|uniref:LAGLIDADG homing endonuclease n=1 Tax=Stephanodiscus triporus TaxID=2934178 RepID=A0ABD3Q025_9STRA
MKRLGEFLLAMYINSFPKCDFSLVKSTQSGLHNAKKYQRRGQLFVNGKLSLDRHCHFYISCCLNNQRKVVIVSFQSACRKDMSTKEKSLHNTTMGWVLRYHDCN